MAEPSAPALPKVGRAALRIVLFGRPDSGKSSLLGALAQAAQVQADTLSWRLADSSGGLRELRGRLYENRPAHTSQEIVLYPVAFEPLNGDPFAPTIEAALIDCDGRAAIAVLEAVAELGDRLPAGELARQVARADGVMLVLSAASNVPIESEFEQFERFLALLEHHRGSRSEISGMPVFLVLTHCDRFAGDAPPPLQWLQRIEQRTSQLRTRFERFRARPDAGGRTAFGMIDLQIAATAVSVPALAQTAPLPETPFGVAELFHESIERASDFRQRRRRSNWSVLSTFAFACAALGLLGAAIAGLILQAELRMPDRNQAAFQSAVAEEATRFENWTQRGQALVSFADYKVAKDRPVPWREWHGSVEKLIAEAEAQTPSSAAKVPGTSATYDAVFRAPSVTKARTEWQTVRQRLEAVRSLAFALGMLDPEPRYPAVLRIPAPPDFTVEMASAVLKRLHSAYPDYARWSVEGLPDPVARELMDAAQVSHQNLMQAGQTEVLQTIQRLGAGGDTPALWRRVRAWLETPAELRDWRALARVVAGVYQPDPVDPVEELLTFLGRDHFLLEFRQLAVHVPADRPLKPDGKLTLFYEQSDGTRTTLGFKLLETESDSRGATYVFIPEAGESVTYQLKFVPGDTFWAELLVRTAEGQARLLTWSVCRSLAYQFERLVRPPRLHRTDQVSSAGELAESVRISVRQGKLPAIPELMPVVKLRAK